MNTIKNIMKQDLLNSRKTINQDNKNIPVDCLVMRFLRERNETT